MQNKWKCTYMHLPNKLLYQNDNITLSGHGFAAFNPSLVYNSDDDTYVLAVRRSTWINKNIYTYLRRKLFYENKSSIEFHVFKSHSGKFKFVDKFGLTGCNKNHIYEDPRITYHKNKFYIVATHVDKAKSTIFPILLQLNNKFELLQTIKFKTDIVGINKNWCPFSHNGNLYIHTDSYPIWRIMKVNLNTGQLTMVIQSNFNYQGSPLLRCSTSPIEYTTKTYLIALHNKDGYSTYSTVFVEVDKESLIPIRATPKICLAEHKRIQFTSGLIRVDDYIIVTLGIADFKYEIRKMKLSRIESLLYTINI